MKYEEFIATKRLVVPPVGIDNPPPLHGALFEFQRCVTRWALKRGRAALWLDTGLGKSWCAIEWSRVVTEHTGKPVLILTPLAVAKQFVHEGEKLGATVNLCREATDVGASINVTNYDRLHKFDPEVFGGIVLDESSCLKDYTSATRNALIETFQRTPFRLACSATPAPNDHTEIGNHAEFLGVMNRTEMLSRFFTHDGGSTQDWRLKGHAQADFWRWVASWAVSIRKPSDIGFDDSGYDLPPLNMREVTVETDGEMARRAGMLFAYEAKTLSEQREARKASLVERVKACAELVNGSTEPWLVWCDLNAESEALAKAIPDAVEVRGSDDPEEKERRIWSFIDGGTRVLVTKPSIAGAGLNMQRCAHTAFVGLSHSWEQWYQAIRRVYRFGQRRPVECYMITSSAEGAVVESLKRKQRQADDMAAGMIEHMRDAMRVELGATRRDFDEYKPAVKMTLPAWLKGAE